MEGFFGRFAKQESFVNRRCDYFCALDADLRSDFQLAIIDLDTNTKWNHNTYRGVVMIPALDPDLEI